MKTALIATALLVIGSSAHAQLLPSGPFTPGHTLRILGPQGQNGAVVGDGGGAGGATTSGSGYLTEIGITNTGTPFCINDALINAVGGYHQLCLGSNALGAGVISLNAVGGASPLGLNFIINGSTVPFPGTGNGDVIGPSPSTVGHLAAFNNVIGTLLKDPNNTLTNLNLAPPSGTGALGGGVATGLFTQHTLTGTNSGANTANQIAVTNSGLNAGTGFTSSFYMEQDVNGSSVQGGQDTLELHLKVLAATSPSNANRNYQAILATGETSANDGGTGTTILTGKGAIFGGGSVAYAHSGATDLLDVNSWEFDWAVETGASAAISAGIVTAPATTNAVHGAVADAHWAMGNQSSSIAPNNGILLSDSFGGQPPLDSTNGCIICTDGNVHQIKNGINFGSYTVTGNYLVGINAAITGIGAYYGSGNTAGALPVIQSNGWVIEDNLSAATADMDFVNLDTTHGGGFLFYQMTGNNAATATFISTLNGSQVSGATGAFATNVTKPFVMLTTTTGVPSGVPLGNTAANSAVTIDSTDHKLCWYETANSAWKCVTGS